MSRSSVPLSELLSKMKHHDQDERYMATSDLCVILQNHTNATAHMKNSSNNSSSSSSGYSPHSSQYSHNSSSHYQKHNSPHSYTLDYINEHNEQQICAAVLKLLDDASNDVQSVAVKTLGELLKIVQEQQAMEIANRLCLLILQKEKKELRDVYTIGLRTLIKTVPNRMGDAVSDILVGRLIEGIRVINQDESNGGETDSDMLSCILDVLVDLITKFGSKSRAIQSRQRDILNATLMLSLSQGQRAEVKKRAGTVIGCLAVVISDELLFHLVQTLLNYIGGAGDGMVSGGGGINNIGKSPVDTQASIQTMCTISGKVGQRLSKQIDKIVPIFLKFCNPSDASVDDLDDEEQAGSSSSNQVRESCFAGFESFLLNCPKEVAPFLPSVIHSSIAFMRYDPNYNELDEDDEDGEDYGMDEDEYENDEDEEEYSDEEDFDNYSDDEDDDAWKVRRSAVRTINALVEAVKADPSILWTEEFVYFGEKKKTTAGALVDRFKERDEACRVDVIECFTGLLRTTLSASQSSATSIYVVEDAMDCTESDKISSVVDNVKANYVPAILKACLNQLNLSSKKTGEKTKASVLALLSVVCSIPGGLGSVDQIKTIFSHVNKILTDSSGTKTLKLDALCMVRIALACGNHEPSDLRNGLDVVLPALCNAVKEDWYKIIAESLRVLAEIPKLIDVNDLDYPTAAVTTQLFDAISPRLAAHDLDQEIKEYALGSSANLLSLLHPFLSDSQKKDLLERILERLESETTRLSALKTISLISKSEPKLDVSCILSECLRELASLLRQQNRGVKQSALETMNIVITSYGMESGLGQDEMLMDIVLKEIGATIVDSDVHLSHLGLLTTISVMKEIPSSAKFVRTYVVPPTLTLSTSALLQDVALESLLSFFEHLVISNTAEFSDLLSALESRCSAGISKQSLCNLSKCIAVISAATNKIDQENVVRHLMSTLESKGQNIQLSLLTLGELGQRVDLSQMPNVSDKLTTTCLEFFQSSSEDVKHAASYALGRSAVGCMAAFLPSILSALESAINKIRYLLLSALKEIIICHQHSGKDMASNIPKILPHLLKHTTDKEEGVRSMVSECLGSLVCLQPEVILPELGSQITTKFDSLSPDEAKEYALKAWTVATAIKFAISAKSDQKLLAKYLPTFLLLLQKNDKMTEEDNMSVRNASLLLVYSAVHHAPQIVAGLMSDLILPSLYELAQLNLERQIDMGCFKHKVDIALPSRKTSLGIFATALENCPSCLDIPTFMPILTKALSDVEDVQFRAHQIVIYMCSHHPEDVAAAVDAFVDPLQKSINKNPKGKKTGIELERANEFKKSGLRTVRALKNVREAMSSEKLRLFVDETQKNLSFRPLLESLAAEH